MKSVLLLALATCLCTTSPTYAQESSKEIQLNDAQCPVMTSRAADKELSTEYNGGTIFFCCKNCLAKFNADPAKYATAAKQQLVVTGQRKAKKKNKQGVASAKKATVGKDLAEYKSQLGAAVKSGKINQDQAVELYREAEAKLKNKPAQSKQQKRDLSSFSAKLKTLVQEGKLTEEEGMKLYDSVLEDLDSTPRPRKKGIRGEDYKLPNLDEKARRKLSSTLPMTSTGNDEEGPVACGFFGWAADATHRFMDNSHRGEPRTIHGLSFRLDNREHNSIGRTWDKIEIRVAHGDWGSIDYNASKEFQLQDDTTLVFDKAWSFPTLKGFPTLKPAEWGGPQNCLNFRFDQPFESNGKDAIYIEFVFSGGKTEDGSKWEGDLPYGFEYFLDSMPENGGWRMAEKPSGLYRAPRVEAVVSYTAGGQSVWTSAPKGMPYLNWDFK